MLVLSRDGSRRIMRGVWAGIANPLLAPRVYLRSAQTGLTGIKAGKGSNCTPHRTKMTQGKQS